MVISVLEYEGWAGNYVSASDKDSWGSNPRLTPMKIPAELRIPDGSVGSGNRGLASLAEFWERSMTAEME